MIKKIYMAPMEGITTRTYRDVFGRHYDGITKCYTPFLSPNQNESFQKRELFEISNRDKQNIDTVPQILCYNPEHFLWGAGEMKKLGYTEVNFNLGCPSGTVVTKKKGSGFLMFPDELEAFFEKVCPEMEKMGLMLSVKTRLGRNDPEEFGKVLDVYNKYSFSELIIHPRIQKDFYKGSIRYEWFDYALENSKNKVVYNGDIFTEEDMEKFEDRYPNVETVMLGRGLIARPFLAAEKLNADKGNGKISVFHDDLIDTYLERFDEYTTICKMKEVWDYMGKAFEVSDKDFKRMRKTRSIEEFKAIADIYLK